MMNDPQQCKSDEALGAVASLMCHQVTYDILCSRSIANLDQAILGKSNGEAWHKHRNALLNIINLRGGFDGIDKLDHLRLTLSWCVPSANRFEGAPHTLRDYR